MNMRELDIDIILQYLFDYNVIDTRQKEYYSKALKRNYCE